MQLFQARSRGARRIGGAALAVGLAVAASACGGRNAGHAIVNVTVDAAADLGPSNLADARAEGGGDAAVADGAGCTLPPVGANLDRDFDVHLATVTGTLTLSGGAPPDSPGLATRGNVVLRERASGDVRTLPVSASGAATFSGTLFAGTYDLSFESAANPALVGLPAAAKTRLGAAVAVAGSTRLDYDLHLIAVSGAVTLGGAALPDSPGLTTRGNVVLRESTSGDMRSLPVGATGPGNFSGSVFPGIYDVSFETVSGAALVGLPTSAETRVATGLMLSADAPAPAPLAFDVQVASVSGKVTAGGTALPDSPTLTTRGSLVFRDPRSGDLRTFALPAVGDGSYAGSMFAGSYDVSFQSAAGATGLVGLPAASTARLASSVAVAAGAVARDFDLAIASLSGTVTAGGSPLPDGSGAGALFAGTYDVTFASAASSAVVAGLPTGGAKRVATAVTVSGAATLSYELPTVMVAGTISSSGAPLPASPALASRGSVVFRDRETGAAIALPVGGSGPAAFAGMVFASSYDVTFETPNSSDLVGLPAAAETRLATDVAIDGAAPPAAFAWDAPVVTLAGRVTLDGAALPDSPGLTTRGNVVFRDKLTGDARALALAATGPGAFAGIAFAGSYDASFETTSNANLVGLPVAAESNLDVGCLPSATCTADPADLSGEWTFTFRDQASWIRWNVALTQTGDALGGRFTAAPGYDGQFDVGMRSGNTITMTSTQNTSTCVLVVDAVLASGCSMTGTAACASGVSQSAFVGTR